VNNIKINNHSLLKTLYFMFDLSKGQIKTPYLYSIIDLYNWQGNSLQSSLFTMAQDKTIWSINNGYSGIGLNIKNKLKNSNKLKFIKNLEKTESENITTINNNNNNNNINDFIQSSSAAAASSSYSSSKSKQIYTKNKLCNRWLDGCFRYEICPFSHNIDELIQPFYNNNILTHNMQYINMNINPIYIMHVCRNILKLKCINEKCQYYQKDYMNKKDISVYPANFYYHSSMIPLWPHCNIKCKSCSNEQQIDIYSRKVL